MAKIPWHFFKIPWQFPDLEKFLFFPDFSLTRGNPDYSRTKAIYGVSLFTTGTWSCLRYLAMAHSHKSRLIGLVLISHKDNQASWSDSTFMLRQLWLICSIVAIVGL